MPETCPIGTWAKLEALLGGKLPAEERARLKAHLEDPCETCLVLLEAMNEDDLFEAAAGQRVAMTEAEADRMFEAVVPPAPQAEQEHTPGLMARIASWMRPAVLVPLAAAALLVLAFGLSSALTETGVPDKAAYTGVKSVGTEADRSWVEIQAFAGFVRDGEPQVGRRLSDGDAVAAGEVVLLRYRLERPAFVYLFATESGGGSQLVQAAAGRMSTGEHELLADGQALALDPTQFGSGMSIILLASPERCSSPFDANEDPTTFVRRLNGCPGSAAATLNLRVGAHR